MCVGVSKKALITGIAGQDGSYLAELLLSEGYEVHGTVRRNSIPENQETRIDHIAKHLENHYADLQDHAALRRVLQKVKPDEIFNLAAQSHVRISFDIPEYTASVNGSSFLALLEMVRAECPEARVYQASSSEMFGNSVDSDGYQRETTPMHPVSPYGCSKLFAYSLACNYRHAYAMHIASGILFNHESPRRGSNFVTSKVIKTAIQIKRGMETELVMGNLDSHRDWGHSRDYVRAMYQILKNPEPTDFVVATGRTHSVRELCETVFDKLGMDYKDYVRQEDKYLRPQELNYLRGDASRIRDRLGWEPTISFDQLIEEMIEYWMQRL